ncbi:protein kinase domain-containing protein [Yinghuangia soli]|uniref:PQQ-binding-like beta-propeller repeat protein n=1 Tax=Yinghuangia soli TaxID=2908204 RepID=A0AA41Q0M9_9ACTN|nr:protein kinase [Yinghuangia soli]MCF2529384.1 PQQ-binding-like beta-propeller repeat protein [Yinghuangia soli]
MEALRPGDPTQLGPYRLRGRLGEGGMGEVFLGVSPAGLRAAVKTVRPEYAHDPGFRDRFRREVAAARRVDSAWTAPIAEADPDSDPPWLATEYLSGIPLSEAVAGHGPLPERAVRVLAAQLVEALMAIHRAGLVHRDLKPSNVILGRDRPRVIDFGISRALDFATHTLTTPGGAVGSPGYMSPEQAAGGQLDQRSDIFALGGVLVYAASGGSPFGAAPQNAMQMLFQIIHGEPNLENVPDGLRGLIADCLAKNPDDRPTLDAILQRTVGDADVAEAAAGGAWLPAPLLAELIQRQNADPADSSGGLRIPGAGGTPPATRPHNGADGVTDVLPGAAPTMPGTAPLTAHLPGSAPGPLTVPAPPAAPPTVGLTQIGPPSGATSGAPFGPAPLPAARRGPSRRTVLIGGAVAGVSAVGAVTGWALTRSSEPGGRKAWELPIGSVTGVYAAAAGKYLVLAGQGGATKDARVAAKVTAVHTGSGERAWQRNTAGPYVGRPVVSEKHGVVFAHSWAPTESSAPSKYHSTVYAFRLDDGTPLWEAQFDSLDVQLAQTADDLLVVTVAPPTDSSSDIAKGKVVAYQAVSGEQAWTFPLPQNAPDAKAPWIEGGTVVVACSPDSSSESGAVYGLRLADGSRLWTWPVPKGQWMTAATASADRAYVRSVTDSASTSYAEYRVVTALSLADGKPLWRRDNLPAGSGPRLKADAATSSVFVLTNGSDQADRDKVDAWIQAVDASTGGVRWQFKPPGLMISSAIVDGPTMYVSAWPSDRQAGRVTETATPSPTPTATAPPPQTGGKVYAVDIATGRFVWEWNSPAAGALTAPQVAGGVVCVGMSADGGHPAAAFGIGAKDGRMRWKYDQFSGVDLSGQLASDDRFHLVAATADSSSATASPDSAPTPSTTGPSTTAVGGGATVYQLRP